MTVENNTSMLEAVRAATGNPTLAATDVTGDHLRRAFPQAMAQQTATTVASEDALKAARAEAAKMERERIAAIQQAAFPGQEALRDQLIAEGATAGDAALRLNADERQRGAGRVQALAAAEQGLGAIVSAPHASAGTGTEGAVQGGKGKAAVSAIDPKLKTKADFTKDWEASAELRTEFPDANTYAAFALAEASGRVKVMAKRGA